MSGFAKVLILVGAGLLIAGGAAAATYNWRQQKLAEANNQKTALTRQLQSTKDDLASAQTTASKYTFSYKSLKGVTLEVYTPQANTSVKSPLYVAGKVPGNWSFEGSFPIRLVDSLGNLVSDTQGKLTDEWTTKSMVPFTAKLTWTEQPQGKLTLVLENDNPSGLSSNEDSLSIQLAK